VALYAHVPMIDVAIDAKGTDVVPAAVLANDVTAQLARMHPARRRPADLTKPC